jgi:hypothetical protein
MRSPAVLLVALLLAACGPTAEVINNPTLPTDSPPGAVGAEPTPAPGETPSGAPGSPTPIPLSTSSSPINLSTPSPPGSGFQVLDGFPVDAAFEVSDVTATANGFVAVGFGGLDGDTYYGRHQGIVWTSADGINWVATFDPNLRNVTPLRVVARDTDIFIGGVLSTCPQLPDDTCTDVPEAGNALWRSYKGGAWARLPQQADMQLGLVDDMFLSGDRIVAYGSGSDDNQTTTAWFSTDGSNWSSTTDLAGLEPISAMTFGSGGFIAFGTRYVPEIEDVRLVAAFSSDGAHFGVVNAPALTGAAIDDVVAGVNGFAGVGYESNEALDIGGVAVHSADGQNWVEASNNDGSFSGSGLEDVHALPSGYVAVGFQPHPDDFTLQDGAVWFSADGQDWRIIGPMSGAFSQLSASALGTSGLVVFAAEQQELDDDTVSSVIRAWFAPLASLTV